MKNSNLWLKTFVAISVIGAVAATAIFVFSSTFKGVSFLNSGSIKRTNNKGKNLRILLEKQEERVF